MLIEKIGIPANTKCKISIQKLKGKFTIRFDNNTVYEEIDSDSPEPCELGIIKTGKHILDFTARDYNTSKYDVSIQLEFLNDIEIPRRRYRFKSTGEENDPGKGKTFHIISS